MIHIACWTRGQSANSDFKVLEPKPGLAFLQPAPDEPPFGIGLRDRIPEVPIARIGSVGTARDTYDNLSPPLCPGHLYAILAVIVLFFEELPTGRNF